MVLVTKKAKTPPIHHQKRSAHHHKRGKHYEKTYWPYLPLLAIAGLAIILNFVWVGLSGGHHGQVLGAATGNITTDGLLTETNQDRIGNRVGSLTIDSLLTEAAQAKANDMVAQNYWAHVSPEGKSPWQFVNQSGYKYTAAGENLAYGFANNSEVLKAWMNSSEHRENLLNWRYQNVGFGIAKAPSFQGQPDQTIVVAMYGRPTNNTAGIAPSLLGNDLPQRQVARVDILAGNAVPGLLAIVVAVSTIAGLVIVFRHVRFAHRAFVYSEEFIVRHPKIDLVLLVIVSGGVLVTRTVGFIH